MDVSQLQTKQYYINPFNRKVRLEFTDENKTSLYAKGMRKSVNYLDEDDDENMEGYILGEIEKEFTRISREANPEYANRRIDLYKEWL